MDSGERMTTLAPDEMWAPARRREAPEARFVASPKYGHICRVWSKLDLTGEKIVVTSRSGPRTVRLEKRLSPSVGKSAALYSFHQRGKS